MREPPEKPPCEKCMVKPNAENENAVNIFCLVMNQFIMGPNGPLDINHLAIDAAMKREGIKSKVCFDKIVHLSRWYMQRIMENR